MKSKTGRVCRIISLMVIVVLTFSALSGITYAESKGKNKNVKKLKSSMNIEIDNIDVENVHITYPLFDEDIDDLISMGYSKSEIKNMDAGDYVEIVNNTVIS